MTRTIGPLTQFKYKLLSHLPGKRGLRYLRKYSRSRATEVDALFEQALRQASGKTCIDLGANMGTYTRKLARVAAHVYAFEPDPWTVTQLRTNLEDLDNVDVIQAAAGVEDGHMPLFRSAKFETDPRKGSLSSTIMAEKANVTDQQVGEVAVMDFCAFLSKLDRDIAIVKMDIEGGEVPLLEALFAHPVLQRIDHVFVETHETKLPDLAGRYRALRKQAKAMTHPKVEMDWQ